MAISRLMDKDPDAEIDNLLSNRVGNKALKALQIFEIMAPRRSEEIRSKELSAEIEKIRDERLKIEKERLAIAEEKKDTED